MNPRKPMYMIGLDYSKDNQLRLKRFIEVTGAESVRKFVVEAIDNEISYRLGEMSVEKRASVLKLMER